MLNIDYTLNRPIPLWLIDKPKRKVEAISSSSKVNNNISDELTSEVDTNNEDNFEESMMEMNNEISEKKYIISVKEIDEEVVKPKRIVSHKELYEQLRRPLFYQELLNDQENSMEETINNVKVLRKIR